jgi:hypothetical protein
MERRSVVESSMAASFFTVDHAMPWRHGKVQFWQSSRRKFDQIG